MAEVEVLNAENQPQINDKGEISHYQFEVQMSCGGCSGAVERALKNIPGIIKCTVNLQTQLVDVWCTIAYDDVLAAIEKTRKKVVNGKVIQILPDDLTV